nr:potassium-transporting ATPase subunit B [Myxococcota bacterium]
MSTKSPSRPLFERSIVRRALRDAVAKLDPRHQLRNPVMFVVEVGSAFTTLLFLAALAGAIPESPGFVLGVSAWLWFTVVFANFAEAMAEG